MNKILLALSAFSLAAAARGGGYAFAFDALAEDGGETNEVHLTTADLPPAGSPLSFPGGRPALDISGYVEYEPGFVRVQGNVANDAPDSALADHATLSFALLWTETVRLTGSAGVPDGTAVPFSSGTPPTSVPADDPTGPGTTELVVGRDYLLTYGVSYTREVYNSYIASLPVSVDLGVSEYDPVQGQYIDILPIYVPPSYIDQIGIQSDSGWVLRAGAVPEPASLAVMGAGALALMRRARK